MNEELIQILHRAKTHELIAISQLIILMTIKDLEYSSPRSLIQLGGCFHSISITGNIDTLVEKKMVERLSDEEAAKCPGGRRVRPFRITAYGKMIIENILTGK
jgi:DNA-binding MarR family transcriptional regulator